jgi:hypothetical protein
MVSEPETRALLDYVLRHRNIGAILTFGESDNLVTAPNRRGELGAPSPVDLLAFALQSTAEARKTGIFDLEAISRFPFGRMFGPDDEGGPGPGAGASVQSRASRMPARRPVEVVNAADLEYFRTVSEKYRTLTGIRSTSATRGPAGAFFEYGYYQFGVPSFSTPGWGLPAPPGAERGPRQTSEDAPPATPATGPEQSGGAAPRGRGAGAPGGGPAAQDAQAAPAQGGTAAFDLHLLKWMESEKVDGFTTWTPYRHPKLGDVEIGGFNPYATSNPPAARIADLGRSHTEFLLYLASLLPRASIAETKVTALGGGLFRVKAQIANSGFLPTATAHGVVSRSVAPTMVQLGVGPDDLVSGDAKTSFFPALEGSGRRQRYEWIVRGQPGSTISLKVLSQKGGVETVNLRLE